MLLDLIEEHHDALAYDFRTKLGVPLTAVFDGRMSWMEAWAIVNQLSVDPTTRLCAALNEWEHPVSREWMVLADLYDLTLRANTDKKKRGRIKPYKRPWPDRSRTRSKKPTVSQKTVRAALKARGH